MTLQDPFTRLSHQHSRRGPLLALLRRLRTVPRRVRYGREGGISGRDRRLLAALDRRLTAEAPALASKYAMFDRLAEGEGPRGVEALVTRSPRRRSRPNRAQLALMMALAAVVALCVTLSTQLRLPANSRCTPAADLVVAAQLPAHSASCASYATNK